MQSEIRDNIVYVAGEVSVQTVNQAALAQFTQQCRQPEIHAQQAAKAAVYLAQHRGASQRIADVIEQHLKQTATSAP